jgi:DNA repair protein RadC
MNQFTNVKIKLVRENESTVQTRITSPMDAYEAFKHLQEEAQEVLAMIMLDTKHNVVGYSEVNRGGLNSSIASPREIAKRALLTNSHAIILAHNHPSGDTTPSRDDIDVTNDIARALALLEIKVLDHLIIGDDSYHSIMSP